MDNGTLNRPSGVVLPLLLRNRRKKEDQSKEKTKDTADQPSASTGSAVSAAAALDNTRQIAVSPEESNAIFSAQELQNQLWRTSVAMLEIQKQLHRGEESYYEDTYGHGNIFSRWDNFIDAKDMGPGAASGEGGGRVVGRRMPADHRWFSGSCPSVGRKKASMAPPPPIITKTSSLSGVSAPRASSAVSSSPSFQPDITLESKVSGRETESAAAATAGADQGTALQPPPSSDRFSPAAAPMDVDSQNQEKDPETAADEKETVKDGQEEEKETPPPAKASTAEPTSTRRKTRKRKAGDA